MTEQIQRLVDQAKKRAPMTAAEREEQRIGFAYGNAPEGSRITKDSARKASEHLRITPKA